LKRGDIVLIVVPGELGKPRPAVVVQSDELGDETTSLIVCPMSSDPEPFGGVRPIVRPGNDNGLRLTSQVMVDKVVALPRRRIRAAIGRLEPAEIEAIDRALAVVLGLASVR
jgi:mRNA interferase MazF